VKKLIIKIGNDDFTHLNKVLQVLLNKLIANQVNQNLTEVHFCCLK